MGLAASQARLLLLTAKNDALEFQAQKIEEERLLLAQEQETIAQEYSDKTTNTIYTCRVTEGGETSQVTMNLDTLAQSLSSAASSTSIVIADANGDPIVRATATYNENEEYEMSYEVEVGGYMVSLDELGDSSSDQYNASLYKYYQNIIEQLNANGPDSTLQYGLSNGAYQLWVQDTSESANVDSTDHIISSTGVVDGEVTGNDTFYVRKSLDSLSSVTSRYYTEDDAAAKAEYDTAMAKVNTLDTRLENKLNQVETQKKAVEQEMESVDSIISSNIERTFQYFS